MVDKFSDPLLTPKETARHLRIPPATVYRWLSERAAGEPLVHAVVPARRGAPSVPFIAVVEAYVLRSLRDLGLGKQAVREAAAAVRGSFGTRYGLATRRIATDGVDIFAEIADGDLVRVRDGQQPFREVIAEYLRYIVWDETDDFPQRLRLPQYPDLAPVVIDPRFGWGAPVEERTKVRVDTVVDLWLAGESLEDVADEFGLSRDQVEALCRTATQAA